MGKQNVYIIIFTFAQTAKVTTLGKGMDFESIQTTSQKPLEMILLFIHFMNGHTCILVLTNSSKIAYISKYNLG